MLALANPRVNAVSPILNQTDKVGTPCRRGNATHHLDTGPSSLFKASQSLQLTNKPGCLRRCAAYSEPQMRSAAAPYAQSNQAHISGIRSNPGRNGVKPNQGTSDNRLYKIGFECTGLLYQVCEGIFMVFHILVRHVTDAALVHGRTYPTLGGTKASRLLHQRVDAPRHACMQYLGRTQQTMAQSLRA